MHGDAGAPCDQASDRRPPSGGLPSSRQHAVARTRHDTLAGAAQHAIGCREQVLQSIYEPIVDLAALALALDQAAVPKAGEVLGDIRLRQAGGVDKVRDATAAAGELLDQRQTGAVGESMQQHGASVGRGRHNR